MMETNIAPVGRLRIKAEKLMKAAYEYWQECQKIGGPRAVIWLSDTDGKLVVFTRGEYRETIMQNLGPLADEISFSAEAAKEKK